MNDRINDVSLQRGPSDIGRVEVKGKRGPSIRLTKEQKALECRLQQIQRQKHIQNSNALFRSLNISIHNDFVGNIIHLRNVLNENGSVEFSRLRRTHVVCNSLPLGRMNQILKSNKPQKQPFYVKPLWIFACLKAKEILPVTNEFSVLKLPNQLLKNDSNKSNDKNVNRIDKAKSVGDLNKPRLKIVKKQAKTTTRKKRRHRSDIQHMVSKFYSTTTTTPTTATTLRHIPKKSARL